MTLQRLITMNEPKMKDLPRENSEVEWIWVNEAGYKFTRTGIYRDGFFDSGLDIFFDEVIDWKYLP